MPKFTKGAQNAVKCLAIKKLDRIVIITDLETKHIAKSVKEQIGKIGAKVLWIEIEQDIGPRPVKYFLATLQEKIRNFSPTVSYYIATCKEGELPKFRMPLLKFLPQDLKCRHGHMPGINNELMLEGMSKDYDKVYDITMKVYKEVKDAREIRVKADGTELVARLSSKLRWKPWPGRIIKQGDWSNLPEGEVFTCPANVTGIISAYVVGDFFSKKYGVLKNPLIVEVKDSRIAGVKCRNKKLEREFKKYVSENENGDRVGEFGIGTLVGLKKFTGNLLQDEKFPGIHIAFGRPFPEHTGASWDSLSHVDLIPLNCSIWVDQELIMKDGKFII